jgi:hypothetical protein
LHPGASFPKSWDFGSGLPEKLPWRIRSERGSEGGAGGGGGYAIEYFLNPAYFYDKTRFNEDGEVGRRLMTCIESCFPDQETQSRIIAQL